MFSDAKKLLHNGGVHIYLYDAVDNLVAQTDNRTASADRNYGYDPLDHLQTAISGSVSREYSYDGNGNRLTESENGAVSGYAYTPGTHHLESQNGAKPQGYDYDAAGNTIRKGNLIFGYGDDNRLTTVGLSSAVPVASYEYNGRGERVKKVAGATITFYHYDSAGRMIAETDAQGDSTREYIYLDDTIVAVIAGGLAAPTGTVSSGNVDELYYVHTDHLATPKAITDQNQNVVWSADATPFGLFTTTASLTFNLCFPGQYFDSETGLHYNYFRYYDPSTGRYITSDPIGLAGGLNTYSYVGGNPVNAIDPSGLDIMVIGGGRRNDSYNFFGHVGLAITGHGMFSYGNDTSLGSAVTDYIQSQSQFRNQTVVLIPTTPDQDAAAATYLALNHPDKNGVGYLDNCAVRTNAGLMAAGFPSRQYPFPGGLTRYAASLPGAKTFFVPEGGQIPQTLLDVLRNFNSLPPHNK